MNNKLNAEKLKNHYEEVYQKGAYENYFTFNSYSIWKAVLDQVEDWRGRSVLEVGCGQGELSAMIAYAGADSIEAIDYSQTAVDIAQERVNLPNVNFACVDGQDVDGIYNLITLAGVLEHTDDPWSFLDKLIDENLSDNGSLITVMPSFMNPRGFIWMTLQTLFDVPMSLSDLHFFSPTDIQEYAKKRDLKLVVTTIDEGWGCGERMLIDFSKRLPNALRDAGMETKNVDKFLEWLDDALTFYKPNEFSGALMVCTLSKDAGDL